MRVFRVPIQVSPLTKRDYDIKTIPERIKYKEKKNPSRCRNQKGWMDAPVVGDAGGQLWDGCLDEDELLILLLVRCGCCES